MSLSGRRALKWSEEYSTGVERIDEQHKMIFQMSEDLQGSLDQGMGGRTYGLMLDFAFRYCQGHFGFEEQCMNEHHCPMAAKNKEEHVGFLEVLASFKQRFDANGFDPADARSLADTIDEWLVRHICQVDVHLRDCVNKD